MTDINKYRLIIFDADGTLTPQRDGSCGEFSYTLLPGVRTMCAWLRAAGVTLAIASNQSERRHAVGIMFQLMWTAGTMGANPNLIFYVKDEAHKKPHPFMIEYIIAQEDVSPADVLFVGDQETDRQAAENAGVDFAWAHEFFGWGAEFGVINNDQN